MPDDHQDFWLFWVAFAVLAAGWLTPFLAGVAIATIQIIRWQARMEATA